MPDFKKVPLELIDDPQFLSRTDYDEAKMLELMESIRKHGLINPVTLFEAGERFNLSAGWRRLTAHRRLNYTSNPAMVYAADTELANQFQLDENELREELSPADEAILIGNWFERFGLSCEEMAKKLNRSMAWIDQRFALLQGNTLVFKALREGLITIGVAQELNKINDEIWIEYYTNQAVGCGATVQLVHQWRVLCNTIKPAVPGELPPPPVPGAPPAPEVNYDRCVFCGGDRDPWNMETVRIHKWHLKAIIEQIAKHQLEV